MRRPISGEARGSPIVTRVVLAVSVDVECDKDANWRIRRPLSCGNVRYGIRKVLAPLRAHWGLKFTMLASPEVLIDDDAMEALLELEGAELGTHLHGEFVEPDADWQAERTDQPQSAYDASTEWQKLANLTELFVQRTGRRPRSFRAGRFGYGQRTFQYLARLGYEVDSSVTPWWRQRFPAGENHDHWGIAPTPFLVGSREEWRDGAGRLVEIPVTIGVPGLLKLPKWLLTCGRRVPGLRRFIRKAGGPENKCIWLRPLRNTVEEMIGLCDEIAAVYGRAGLVVLNMMFHSNELMPGMSPYCASEEDLRRLMSDIEGVVRGLSIRYALQPCTLSEARGEWLRVAGMFVGKEDC